MTIKKLSQPMRDMLVAGMDDKDLQVSGKTNTTVALMDRGLIYLWTNRQGGHNQLRLTADGIRIAREIIAADQVTEVAEVSAATQFAELTADMPAEDRELWRKAATMTPADMAQDAANVHFANATSDDHGRSFCDSPTYRMSHRAMLDSIAVAYPMVDPREVYNVWVDSGESVAYCVNWIRENGSLEDFRYGPETSDRVITDEWETNGHISWTRTIRGIDYAFGYERLTDGRIRLIAVRENSAWNDDRQDMMVTTRTRLHTIILDTAPITDDDYPANAVDAIPANVDQVDDMPATLADMDQASEDWTFRPDDYIDAPRPVMMAPRAPRTAMSVRERKARKDRRKAQKSARKAHRKANR